MADSTAPFKVKDNELFAQAKVDMVRAHFVYLQMFIFKHEVTTHKFKDSRIEPILLDLAKIIALRWLIDDCGRIYDSGYFVTSAWKNMNTALDILIKKIRP
jgi:Acyl-CoA oxidase